MPISGDVRRLLEHSLRQPVASAFAAFPMFSSKQIRALYAISREGRRQLLKADYRGDLLQHFVQRFEYHRNPAQVEKMIEQAIDPSNE
jgi:hypothetical protein